VQNLGHTNATVHIDQKAIPEKTISKWKARHRSTSSPFQDLSSIRRVLEHIPTTEQKMVLELMLGLTSLLYASR
jgi:hypothetical protein